MRNKKSINLNPKRKIETQRHAAIPVVLFEILFRASVELALSGNKDAAQWFFDELETLNKENIRKEYNGLRWKGLGNKFYGMPCTECGKPADAIDHIVPISKGETNYLDNLQPMCWDCNRKKSNR